ncbi:MAG: cytidylate kinase-like family protein [Desulforegulaceae bacterium]|nr:cytidylate kinase-like family protein [Desulforegulaceae bacterium]
MQIVTISREFGSGGRELGKRLADFFGCDYYDKEIITFIASNKGMDENYVERAIEQETWQKRPLTFRKAIAGISLHSVQTGLLLEQKKVIEQIAATGKDFVIVGRNADVLLKKYKPFNIFVCADMKAKISRCIEIDPEYRELTAKEIEKKIRRVDKNRAQVCELISGNSWGDRYDYQLTLNTTDWNIKELTPVVAEFVKSWCGRTEVDSVI